MSDENPISLESSRKNADEMRLNADIGERNKFEDTLA